MKKVLSLVLALLTASTLLFGCAPAEQAPETTKGVENIMQKEDPKKDDVLNILMVGNSFSYSFVDELYDMAKAAGIKMRICNIYASGCSTEKHWKWWKSGEANYEEFWTTDDEGRRKQTGVNLEYCLKQYNWDVISLQEASGAVRLNTAEQALESSHTYRKELIAYFKEQFPQSRHVWHQTWAYQIGFDDYGYKVEDTTEQNAYYERMKKVAVSTCEEFGLERINSGDAWQIARANPVVGDHLCEKANGKCDYYHDGDMGGGQYLNACVWFEVITGQSCIGNTFRPAYAISEEKIIALQQAAHEAVGKR